MKLVLFFTAFFFLSSAMAQQQKWDQHSEQALKETQDLLKNQEQRDKAVQSDPNAKATHSEVEKLSGSSQNTNAIYGLSAEIFESIARQSNGDPQVMQKLLQEAARNPEAFANSLTPAQREKLRGVAAGIEKKQNQSPPRH